MKKIGMLLEAEFPPDVRVENEAISLARSGFEVHIFALTFGKGPKLEEWKPGVWIHRKRISRRVYNKIHITVLKWPFYARWWEKFLLRSGVHWDAIHVHDLPLARVGLKLAQQQSIPFVLDLHENYPAALGIWEHSQTRIGRLFLDIPSWRQYEKDMIRRANRIIVVVNEALERFRTAGISEEKFTVVSNTLNIDTFPLRPEKGETKTKNYFRVTYVGGFGVHRGLETAIQAMPVILNKIPTVRLILVGTGRNFADLKELARNLGVKEHVDFPGWVPFEESARAIWEADVCIIPHLSTEHTNTTVPHKLFQYMFLKKPVLVSSSPPLKRIVQETRSGEVFHAGDPEDFARKLVEMFRSKNLTDWGANGHKAVLETYNWEKESQKLVQLYRELFNG